MPEKSVVVHPEIAQLHRRVEDYVEGRVRLDDLLPALLHVRACPPQYVHDAEGRRIGTIVREQCGTYQETAVSIGGGPSTI